MSLGGFPDDPQPIESDFEKVLSPDGGRVLLSICDFGSPLSSNASKPVELKDESDFEKVTSSDGGLALLSICGFGSLLSGKDVDQ